MPDSSSADIDSVLVEIHSQAAAWISKLHAADRTAQVDVAFQRWLKADPRHREVFESANELWIAASALPKPIVKQFPPWHQVQLRQRTIRLTAAFAAVLLFALGAVFIYGLRDRELATEVGELRTVTLVDGTRVTLNTATRLTVQYDEHIRRVMLTAGEASFEVAKNPRQPFMVRAGDREVTALGTSFIVRRDSVGTAVTLVEGKVSVSTVSEPTEASDNGLAPMHPEAILHPGERLTVTPGRPSQLDRPALSTLTAWQQGRVVFERVSLAQAVDEMNRYSERKVIIDGLQVSTLTVSGVFRTGDQDSFALALRDTYSLRTREEHGRIILSVVSGGSAESAVQKTRASKPRYFRSRRQQRRPHAQPRNLVPALLAEPGTTSPSPT